MKQLTQIDFLAVQITLSRKGRKTPIFQDKAQVVDKQKDLLSVLSHSLCQYKKINSACMAYFEPNGFNLRPFNLNKEDPNNLFFINNERTANNAFLKKLTIFGDDIRYANKIDKEVFLNNANPAWKYLSKDLFIDLELQFDEDAYNAYLNDEIKDPNLPELFADKYEHILYPELNQCLY